MSKKSKAKTLSYRVYFYFILIYLFSSQTKKILYYAVNRVLQ